MRCTVMSRIGVLLLLLLVCCRSPSNAAADHALDAARRPVAPATGDVIRSVAGVVRKADGRVAASGDGDDDRAARRQLSEDDDDEHREWGKYGPPAWEKRRWSAANSKAAWGKRDEEDDFRWGQRAAAQAAWNKRRWSANNGMRAWGKRSRRTDVDGRSKRSVRDDGAPTLVDYGRWAPVKRQWRRTAARYDGPKRKWEFNTMKSWGKRRDDYDVDDRNWPKRSWSSDNSLRIWG